MRLVVKSTSTAHIKGLLKLHFKCILLLKFLLSFNILKTKKNFKFKKMTIGKMLQKGQKWRMGQNFFQAHNPHQKTKKISIAKLNSFQWLPGKRMIRNFNKSRKC